VDIIVQRLYLDGEPIHTPKSAICSVGVGKHTREMDSTLVLYTCIVLSESFGDYCRCFCEVLRLVRQPLNALALCLGQVLVMLAYLLPIRCLHSLSLYSEGLVVLRDHTNRVCGVATTVYRRERGLRWFGQKLDCEDGGEGFGEAISKTHLRIGNTRGLFAKLPD
jgi:hypothetical protein